MLDKLLKGIVKEEDVKVLTGLAARLEARLERIAVAQESLAASAAASLKLAEKAMDVQKYALGIMKGSMGGEKE
jgi:hypothetical protein